MGTGTFFIRTCPTCGRSLEIRVELLGREVECVHCLGRFNTAQQTAPVVEHRVDQALARAQRYIDSHPCSSADATPGETC